MAGAAQPLAPCVVTAPTPSFEEVVREMQRCQTENVRLRAKLAAYDGGARAATEAMRGALRSSELEHALRGVAATARGKRQLTAALRPARADVDFNAHAATARNILDL